MKYVSRRPKEKLERAAASYISKKTGFTREEIVKILQLYVEYIAFELIDKGKVAIAHVASFELNSTKKDVVAQISPILRRWALRDKERIYKKIENTKEEPVIYKKYLSDKYKEITEEHLIRLENQGVDKEITRTYRRSDLKFLSFLKYEQNDFPYNKDWRDDCTGRTYDYELVKEKMEIYAEKWPVEFRAFQWLWVGVIKRKDYMVKHSFKPEYFMWKWRTVANVLLLMIEHPLLMPTFARELTKRIDPYKIRKENR